MRKLILLTALLTISTVGFAHQDTPLTLEKNGDLTGLPEQFGHAHFDRNSFTLTVSGKKITIPECVTSPFQHLEKYDIRFSASWYHTYEPGSLPPYIVLDVYSSEEPNGYQFLFDLNTLEVVAIAKPDKDAEEISPNRFYFFEEAISEECRRTVSSSILTVK